MSEENQLRSLISLGAFSHVIGGGGEIPEDLQVNSVTACSVKANGFEASGNSAFVSGPLLMAGSSGNHVISSVEDNLHIDCDLIHTVGTRQL